MTRRLLNDIFRGFHTVKGGAGFLNASELVTLCHLTENLFDRLRNGEMDLTPELMDIIMAATNGVRQMFGELGQAVQPRPAAVRFLPDFVRALEEMQKPRQRRLCSGSRAGLPAAAADAVLLEGDPDWQALHAAVTGQAAPTANAVVTKSKRYLQQPSACSAETAAPLWSPCQ